MTGRTQTGVVGLERPRRRLGLTAIILAAIAALGITVVVGMVRDAPAAPRTIASTSLTATTRLFVHVGGAVVTPGLYTLDEGGRVMDAIAAAGGFTPEAARDAVNLARPVADGEQVLVPTSATPGDGTGVAGDGPSVSDPTGAGAAQPKVSLSTASAAQLQQLPRIGPALAARIVTWRAAHGGFRSVDDLDNVEGIGPKLVDSLRELVVP